MQSHFNSYKIIHLSAFLLVLMVAFSSSYAVNLETNLNDASQLTKMSPPLAGFFQPSALGTHFDSTPEEVKQLLFQRDVYHNIASSILTLTVGFGIGHFIIDEPLGYLYFFGELFSAGGILFGLSHYSYSQVTAISALFYLGFRLAELISGNIFVIIKGNNIHHKHFPELYVKEEQKKASLTDLDMIPAMRPLLSFSFPIHKF